LIIKTSALVKMCVILALTGSVFALDRSNMRADREHAGPVLYHPWPTQLGQRTWAYRRTLAWDRGTASSASSSSSEERPYASPTADSPEDNKNYINILLNCCLQFVLF